MLSCYTDSWFCLPIRVAWPYCSWNEGAVMTVCRITVPIRAVAALQFQPTGTTCARCGEEFRSYARGSGLTEQTCACGLVYRVETLTVDSVLRGEDRVSTNDSRFGARKPRS